MQMMSRSSVQIIVLGNLRYVENNVFCWKYSKTVNICVQYSAGIWKDCVPCRSWSVCGKIWKIWAPAAVRKFLPERFVFIWNPDRDFTKFQHVQNWLAHVLTKSLLFTRRAPLLCSLLWLPVNFRIDFKIYLLTYKTLKNNLSISRTS